MVKIILKLPVSRSFKEFLRSEIFGVHFCKKIFFVERTHCVQSGQGKPATIESGAKQNGYFCGQLGVRRLYSVQSHHASEIAFAFDDVGRAIGIV